jgi:hypothetical protein
VAKVERFELPPQGFGDLHADRYNKPIHVSRPDRFPAGIVFVIIITMSKNAARRLIGKTKKAPEISRRGLLNSDGWVGLENRATISRRPLDTEAIGGIQQTCGGAKRALRSLRHLVPIQRFHVSLPVPRPSVICAGAVIIPKAHSNSGRSPYGEPESPVKRPQRRSREPSSDRRMTRTPQKCQPQKSERLKKFFTLRQIGVFWLAAHDGFDPSFPT